MAKRRRSGAGLRAAATVAVALTMVLASPPRSSPCPSRVSCSPSQRRRRIWLVFDLNGTLASTSKQRKTTGRLAFRPGIDCLRRLKESGLFRLALWSSAKRKTVRPILAELEARAGVTFERILHRSHTLPADMDGATSGNEWDTVKPLRAYFGPLERVLMIDDTFKCAKGEEDNLIHIPTWRGSQHHDELLNVLVDNLLSLPRVLFGELQGGGSNATENGPDHGDVDDTFLGIDLSDDHGNDDSGDEDQADDMRNLLKGVTSLQDEDLNFAEMFDFNGDSTSGNATSAVAKSAKMEAPTNDFDFGEDHVNKVNLTTAQIAKGDGKNIESKTQRLHGHNVAGNEFGALDSPEKEEIGKKRDSYDNEQHENQTSLDHPCKYSEVDVRRYSRGIAAALSSLASL